MNERGQALLDAYRSSTAPDNVREDELFAAIVRRIVTTDANASESPHDAEDAEPQEAEVVAHVPARRSRRAVVVATAVATAAIAAGLVLGLSLKGQVATPHDAKEHWQAPDVEAAGDWLRALVPGALLEEDADAPLPEAPTADDVGDGWEITDAGEPMPAATRRTRSRAKSRPRASASSPAASTPSPRPPATRSSQGEDTWGAPSSSPATPGAVPGRPGPRQAGGGLPSAPSSKTPSKDDGDSGKGASKSKPSAPSAPSSSGSKPTGPSSQPTPPKPPEPRPPTDEPEPDEPSLDCEQRFEVCQSATPGPECDAILAECVGEPHDDAVCAAELDVCLADALDPMACEGRYAACTGDWSSFPPDPCLVEYQACAMGGPEHGPCLEEFGVCVAQFGTPIFGSCEVTFLQCEAFVEWGDPLQCGPLLQVCEDSTTMPYDECDGVWEACMVDVEPGQEFSCDEQHQACVDATMQGGAFDDDPCMGAFDECLLYGGSEECEEHFFACMGG